MAEIITITDIEEQINWHKKIIDSLKLKLKAARESCSHPEENLTKEKNAIGVRYTRCGICKRLVGNGRNN